MADDTVGINANGARHTRECDVLVIGSGAAGLAAAITARLDGLTVIVAEKEAAVGGSTARSGGNLWIPCNHLARTEGVDDSLERALEYIRAEAGEHFEETRSRAYLANAIRMAEAFHQNTSAVRFVRTDAVGDNHPQLPGAAEFGRTLTTPPFDGRALGARLALLAAPLPELTFYGMQIWPGRELNHFFNAFRSTTSLSIVVRRLARHVADVLRYGRTTHLVNGNGLSARLLKSALDLGVELALGSPAVELSRRAGRIDGAWFERQGRRFYIRARRGVMLACGGYPKDTVRRQQLSPLGALGASEYSLAPEGNTGDGLRLAEAAGAMIENRLSNTISWTPVSRPPRARGFGVFPRGFGLFPHGFDRNKPGVIAVTRHGRRFTNEAIVGNDFVRAMVHACGRGPVEGFFITDHRAIRRYGLGVARPAPALLGHLIRCGYLLRARTLADLAARAGIDAAALLSQVERFNREARDGIDQQFHRGETQLERRNGDSRVGPNPGLAPVERAPFYAVKIYPGDFSTLAGLRIDEHARVLDEADEPIPGLYAAGNDALSLFGGMSPAGGATLGPAMTFGYIAAKHLSVAPAAVQAPGHDPVARPAAAVTP